MFLESHLVIHQPNYTYNKVEYELRRDNKGNGIKYLNLLVEEVINNMLSSVIRHKPDEGFENYKLFKQLDEEYPYLMIRRKDIDLANYDPVKEKEYQRDRFDEYKLFENKFSVNGWLFGFTMGKTDSVKYRLIKMMNEILLFKYGKLEKEQYDVINSNIQSSQIANSIFVKAYRLNEVLELDIIRAMCNVLNDKSEFSLFQCIYKPKTNEKKFNF
jgi:hypothetical protein